MNILEEVRFFCWQKNSVGALLITGKWGSGKTFFINEVLVNETKAELILLRISLFGVTSSQEINKKIRKEYLKIRFPSKKPKNVGIVYNTIKKGTDAAAEILPIVKLINKAISTEWLDFIEIKKFDNREIVLIFDDLERCDMSIQEIFGCLNEYIENRKLKSIIIADEEKIISKKNENASMSYEDLKEKLINRTIKIEVKHFDIVHSILNDFNENILGY